MAQPDYLKPFYSRPRVNSIAPWDELEFQMDPEGGNQTDGVYTLKTPLQGKASKGKVVFMAAAS